MYQLQLVHVFDNLVLILIASSAAACVLMASRG